MQKWAARLLAATTMLALAGCPGNNGGTDSGTPDSGTGDSGPRDSGPVDARPPMDAPMDLDAWMMDVDAGDSGMVMMDDAGTDSGMMMPTPCEQVAAVRSTGMGDVAGVLVTYVRPLIGTDPAGFFVQCAPMGPALFVAVDPTSLTPTPTVGDVVSFTATTSTTMGTGMQHRVTAISGYTRTATGMPVAGFVQDVTAATDLVSALDDRESELITLDGTIAGAFGNCGTGMRCAQITTTGVTAASNALRLRITSAAETASGLRLGCAFRVGPTPLWRFNADAQPSAFAESEITMVTCPPRPQPAADQVVISEIANAFTDTDTDREWLELHNPSTTDTYDLNGCVLTDGTLPSPNMLMISSSLEIGPGGYLVIGGTASEAMPDYTLPSSFTLDEPGDTLTLTCGAVVVDTVVYDATFPSAVNDAAQSLSSTAQTAMANDMASNWCAAEMTDTYGTMGARGTPGAANPMCPAVMVCMPPDHLVINEIDYDMTMNPDSVEFVEIYNPTTSSVSLDGMSLVFGNGGSAGAHYRTVMLTGSLAAGAYAVVGSAAVALPGGVARFDLGAATDAIQNGAPDGVALIDSGGALIDAVSYEGAMTMIRTSTGGTIMLGADGASAGTDPGDGALARTPNGCDRDTPGMDWMLAATPTPGAPN